MSLVALGVTGGIGAYKAVEVARGLQKRGHDVVALMTRSARRFVGPVTFEAITRRRVITDQFAPGMNADIEHIALTTEIDLLLIAPATANIIAKLAHGIADDFLTSFVLALRKPILLAPAMNTNMFEHPAVQANLATLAARGVQFVDPGSGYLACGWIGKGRLAEPDEIAEAAHRMMLPVASLGWPQGARHGGADLREHRSGPVHRQSLQRPHGRRHCRRSGAAWRRCDAGAGAVVARPAAGEGYRAGAFGGRHARGRDGAREGRRRGDHGGGGRGLHAGAGRRAAEDREDGRGADAHVDEDARHPRRSRTRARRLRGGQNPLLVGFAAETHDVIAHAREKLTRKQIDLIVANDVARADAGFEVDTNAATLISHDDAIELPLQSKQEMAGRILDRVTSMLRAEAEVVPPPIAQPAPRL